MRKSRGITSYSGAHVNVTLHRGKATQYDCHCGKPAHEWALSHNSAAVVTNELGQTFSTNPDDYMPMCRRCHRLYDKAHVTHCPQGHAYEGHNILMDAGKRKCRTCHNERARLRPRHVTPEAKARRNAYQRAYRARLKEAS